MKRNAIENEKRNAAHTSRWATFEIIFGIPFIAGFILDFIFPLPISSDLLLILLKPIGLLLLIAGLLLIIVARREFSKLNQPTNPGQPTSQLITSGVFSFSRNPLYLGGIFFVAGFAMLCTLFWVLVCMPVSLVACHYLLIVPEERYLAKKFGSLYLDYTATVNRWVGRVPFRKEN